MNKRDEDKKCRDVKEYNFAIESIIVRPRQVGESTKDS